MNNNEHDRLEQPCERQRCGGTYTEATINDDWEGYVTCSNCEWRVTRFTNISGKIMSEEICCLGYQDDFEDEAKK